MGLYLSTHSNDSSDWSADFFGDILCTDDWLDWMEGEACEDDWLSDFEGEGFLSKFENLLGFTSSSGKSSDFLLTDFSFENKAKHTTESINVCAFTYY